MSHLTAEIPCPCGTAVPVDVDRLLRGAAFCCPCCRADLRLDGASVPVVTETIAGLRSLAAPAARRARH